jgi:hypothetical protein
MEQGPLIIQHQHLNYMYRKVASTNAHLLIRKSTFCQKVTVHKSQKSTSYAILKVLYIFASKRDRLALSTIR